MYLLWKTSEENGLLGQSILGFMGTAWPSLFVSLKKELEVTMSVIKIEMPQAVREIIETLESAGYEAQILEFIDMEHTPKNILIRAVKTGKKKQNQDKIKRIEEFLQVDPTLGRLLKDRGEV